MADELAKGSVVAAEKLTLLPAKLDLKGQKPQYTLFIFVLLVMGLSTYWSTLSSGFLLDDFLHFDYVYRALQGDWTDFLHNFAGNWAGSDIMKSYRPVASVSLLIDCWLWKADAWGYHLTNVLLHMGAAIFMGLVVLEITGLYGNRLGAAAAIWTALLFSLYPLHPEATAWIIGRVDLLCGLFYYASIFLYLRFRSFRAKHCLYLSLICFMVALASKEMAATLPGVILLIEALLSGSFRPVAAAETSLQKLRRVSAVLLFFAVLGLFATWRALCLGSVVGGYCEGMAAPFSFSNFTDPDSLRKVFFPHNDEVPFVKEYAPIIDPILLFAYLAAGIAFLVKVIGRAVQWCPLLFLLSWALLAVIPAFQIWHIWPNLVGSRLFYLSSGPFCAFLVLLAIPACESLSRNLRYLVLAVSLLSLSLISSSYALYLAANNSCWVEAGWQLRKFTHDLRLLQQSPQNKVLLTDLPTDYRGSGMLTRQQYLEILLSKPLSGSEHYEAVNALVPFIDGNRQLIWPFQAWCLTKDLLNSGSVPLYWHKEDRAFLPQLPRLGTAGVSFDLRYHLVSPAAAAGKRWQLRDSFVDASVRQTDEVLAISPGHSGVRISFPIKEEIGQACDLVTVELEAAPYGGKPVFDAGFSVIAEDGTKTHVFVPASRVAPNVFIAWIGRTRAWYFCRKPETLELNFHPGSGTFMLKKLVIEESINSAWQAKFLLPVSMMGRAVSYSSVKSTALFYDCSSVSGAESARVLITAPNRTFEEVGNSLADVHAAVPSKLSPDQYMSLALPALAGSFKLENIAPAWLKTRGLYQCRIIACSPDGELCGLPSEPLTVLVE